MQRSVDVVRPLVNNLTKIFNKAHSEGKNRSALNPAFPIWTSKSVLQSFKTAKLCRNCHRESDMEFWLPSVKEKNMRNSVTGKYGVISLPLKSSSQPWGPAQTLKQEVLPYPTMVHVNSPAMTLLCRKTLQSF